MKLECLYMAEAIARKGITDIKKRKFLRKILGHKKISTNLIYFLFEVKSRKCQNISTTMKERRMV